MKHSPAGIRAAHVALRGADLAQPRNKTRRDSEQWQKRRAPALHRWSVREHRKIAGGDERQPRAQRGILALALVAAAAVGAISSANDGAARDERVHIKTAVPGRQNELRDPHLGITLHWN